jgi:F-type H+-transporting ATPase subunit delta
MPFAVATRYAKALVDLVTRPGSGLEVSQAAGQLKAFEQALAESTELRHVLLSPAVPGARKRAVVAKLAGRMGISPLIRNFLYVVIGHRRTQILGEIREAAEALLDERMGVVRADVASAVELAGPQRAALAAALGRATGKRVRMEFSVDPGLLGGVKARIGSTVYDGTVRGQLEGLRRELVSE